jgi:hypothetical protein
VEFEEIEESWQERNRIHSKGLWGFRLFPPLACGIPYSRSQSAGLLNMPRSLTAIPKVMDS